MRGRILFVIVVQGANASMAMMSEEKNMDLSPANARYFGLHNVSFSFILFGKYYKLTVPVLVYLTSITMGISTSKSAR